MIVLDAGTALESLLASPGGAVVNDHLAREMASAPSLLDAEVLHRLVVLRRHGDISSTQLDRLIGDLHDLPAVRLDHRPLLLTAATLATALSGYDALYAAAAQLLRATLVTTDARLARTCSTQLTMQVTIVPVSPRP